MAALTIRDVSRRSGLSEPTLRYYEEIGLIGPIARDESSGHRRYRTEDLAFDRMDVQMEGQRMEERR